MKKFIGSKNPNVWKKSAVVSLCAVLVAVSAFFYAPMEADAAEFDDYKTFFDFTVNLTSSSGYQYGQSPSKTFALIDSSDSFYSNIVGSDYYLVSYDVAFSFKADSPVTLRHLISRHPTTILFYFNDFKTSDDYLYTGVWTRVFKGYELINPQYSLTNFYFSHSNGFNLPVDVSLKYKINSVTPLTGSESSTYQQGYNAGYSVGEQVGEDIGYSKGFDVGFEQGEDQGYESGFEAGKDSVDTDSYYDMGYSAGYDAGYLSGYDEGYDEGYSAALKSVQGSSTEQQSPIVLNNLEDVECIGNPFYVSSYGLIDMEEYQSGSNGYFYNTVPGTYNGITNVSYNIPLWKLNNNAYPKFEGNRLRVSFTLYELIASLDSYTASSTLDANLMSSKIREVYVTYKGKKYYGNYSTSTSFADFDFIVDDFVNSGLHTIIDGDMTLNFVLENSVTIVTNSNVSHYVSAKYTPKVHFDLGRNGNSLSLIPYVTNDRVSANIQNQTNEITGALEQQKEVQENQLEEQKEQTETQKGIAQSIKDFFGSFFDNLINSIIHVIVPTKEEMGELFNRLNDFFSETFGFLYYPFEFIINAFNIFLVADSGTGLTLPAFSIMGYEVWGSQTYDIASEPIVGEIFGFVRMGTGAMLVMWFVNFLKDFFDKRFGGGGS